jgi:4-hydroxy-tetrahydrodipicolinate synthase
MLDCMTITLAGLYVPLITPFSADGELARDVLEKLAHDVLDDGAAGIVALGTTSESATLSATERRTVLDVCARVSREHGTPLIAGAGSNDTAGSVQALRELTAWPEIEAVLTIVPYFTRPSEDGVVAHFTRLASDSPLPLIVYNVPCRTGRSISLDALRRLAALPNVIGLKHAVGGIDADTVEFMADPPEHFAVLAGDDVFAASLLALGAAGAILASAHLETRLYSDLVNAWRAGEGIRGRALGHRAAPLSAALFAEPNPTVIKAVLHAQGRIPTPAVRMPLLTATPAATDAALTRLTVLEATAEVPA